MAELVVKPKPDVFVYQEFSGEVPTIRRPLMQAAVVAQCFQLVGSAIPGGTGALAGSYTGVSLAMNFPDLIAGAEVDDFSSLHDDEPNLLDEVVVEVVDGNGTFDVSDDDQTSVQASGVTLGAALHTWKTILSGTVVTTEEGSTRLTFPADIDLLALGVQVPLNGLPGDKLRFATLAADLIDPAEAAISAEIDSDTGLPQEFDIIGLPARNVVDVAILGESWSGFAGEADVQVEIRRYPSGEGVVVAPHEDGTGANLSASTTFSIVNPGIDFRDFPVQPGDFLRLTSSFEDIVGDASIVIDNVEDIVTPAPTTLPPTTPEPVTAEPDVIQGSGILGSGLPIQAGKIFTDPDADFVSAGVVAFQDVLRFITDEDDLSGTQGVVSVRNTSDIQIIEVISATQLRLAKGLVTESPGTGKSFQYNVVKKNQVVAATGNLDEVKILAVLGPNSLLLETALAAEVRTASRQFEFSVIRKRVVNGEVRISYRALRSDLVGTAVEVQADPSGGTTYLVSRLGPVLSSNPLALMASFAALQTTQSVLAVCVHHWTLEEVSKALDTLSSQESVYGIAMATHDPTFLTMLQAHVDKFSDATQRNGLERYMMGSWEFPRQSVVVSTVSGSANALNVQSQRDRVKLGTGASWDATDAFPNYVIDFDPNGTGRTVPFNVNGAKVLRSSAKITAIIGTDTLKLLEEVHADQGAAIPGPYRILTQVRELQENAQRIAQFNAAIGDRRVDSVFPPQVKANVNGEEEVLEAYHACAGLVGARSALTPSLPMTFRPIAGFSGTVGGQGIYSEEHFNIMAGGGTWVLFQETYPDGPVLTRHQLTTDIRSDARAEDSVRTALDYGAKVFRSQLRPLVGRTVLTEDFITLELRPRVAALLDHLIEEDVFGKGSSVIRVERHPTKKTTAVVDVRVEVLYPMNYVDVTLVIN